MVLISRLQPSLVSEEVCVAVCPKTTPPFCSSVHDILLQIQSYNGWKEMEEKKDYAVATFTTTTTTTTHNSVDTKSQMHTYTYTHIHLIMTGSIVCVYVFVLCTLIHNCINVCKNAFVSLHVRVHLYVFCLHTGTRVHLCLCADNCFLKLRLLKPCYYGFCPAKASVHSIE